MKNEDDFKGAVGIVYAIIGSLYTILGTLAYVMFGGLTREEITMNLVDGKFVRWISAGVVVLVTMNALVKYPVILGPVNRAVERVVGVKGKWLPTSRLVVSVVVAAVAVGFPNYSKVMGLMGYD